ncbi:MAG: sugar transferase [Chloroflexota bacterium]|nr:MAG: sugar transferase [Chloroflexota bacterium]
MDNLQSISFEGNTTSAFYAAAKRWVDIVVSALLLVILAPVLGICALAVRLDSPGPVLFRQQRVGEQQKPFTMLKFRSMFASNDARLHKEYTAAFIQGKAQTNESGDGAVFKIVDDPRITRVGLWLRRSSLDELPQLWNVLMGEMSLVGPRPPIPYEVAHYQPAHLGRLAVKPGITGLWQVSGRSVTTFEQMVAIDLEYIRTRSLALDTAILLKTIPVVLLARGAR